MEICLHVVLLFSSEHKKACIKMIMTVIINLIVIQFFSRRGMSSL